MGVGNFTMLKELLNTTNGMTILRNNAGQDDGTDTVTGVNWFTFNGIVASKIYVSGNSFVGFGSSAEHLKVCRRDGKMYYLYRQEGTIGITRFLKIRWEGYTRYNVTSSSYSLIWELFLFDDGGLYLNIIQVPTDSSYLGTNQLVCGSKTYNFAVTVSTPIAYSFFSQDDGTFVVSTDMYPVITNRVPFGFVEFAIASIKNVSNANDSNIFWGEDVPENTTLKVFTRLSSGTYAQCQNGGKVEGINKGLDLSNETLYVKVEMETNDPLLTPVLYGIKIFVRDQSDVEKIILNFPSGTQNSIQRAVGDIMISYDGSGTLAGQGGPVFAFDQTFTPVGLDPKNNPNNVEHINISNVQIVGGLTRIRYIDSSENEHIIVGSVSAVGALIHIDDI